MRYLNIFLLLLLTSCYLSDELPPDQNTWNYKRPGDFGFDEQKLLALDQQLKDGDFQATNSLIVIKNDAIIFENYYDNASRSELRAIGPATNIVTISALGQLVADGYIGSLDDPIHEYLPHYFNIFDAQPDKKKITIRHLLTNKSGFVWTESLFGYWNPKNDLNLMKTISDDWVSYILKQDMEADPGQRLVLNSGSGLILARMMQHALGQKDLEEYINDFLFKKIGITRYQWKHDPSGNLDGTTGLMLTDLDFTRLGYLFMNQGLWKRERIIDEDWVFEMLKIQTSISQQYSIGYGWLFFTANYAYALEVNPLDLFFTPVYTGQHLFVLPKEEMVICISADNLYYNLQSPSLCLFDNLFRILVNEQATSIAICNQL